MYNELEYDNEQFERLIKRNIRLNWGDFWSILKVVPASEIRVRSRGIKVKLGKIVNGIGDAEIYLPFNKESEK
jgi:hypothetical protein